MARSLGSRTRVGRTLNDNRRDCRAIDICKRLGRKHDRRVLLAQRLQPLTELAGKVRIIKSEPALVDDEQRWTAVEAAYRSGETDKTALPAQRRCRSIRRSQRPERRSAEVLILGIEQSVIGTAEAIGLERPLQNIRLEKNRKAREGPLLARSRRQRASAVQT